MEERRSQMRRQPNGELSVRVKAFIPARVLDISTRGMRLELSSLLRVGVPCEVKVRVDDQDVGLPGTIQWCRAHHFGMNEKGEKVLYYWAGLALGDVEKQIWQRLEVMLGGAGSVGAALELSEPKDYSTSPPDPSAASNAPRGPIKVKIDTFGWRKPGE